MSKLFVISFVSLFITSASFAEQTTLQYYRIKSVNVHEEAVDADQLMQIRTAYKLQDLDKRLGKNDDILPNPIDEANDMLDGIINFGAKIWKVLQGMTPVVNLNSQRANALPRDLQDWSEMETWSDVEAKQYNVSYINGFGAEVVRFKILLTYSYGGSFRGTGQYLSQVGFLPNSVYVAPLYTLDGESEVVRVMNVGKREAPIAGMELNLTWKVKNVLHYNQEALNFYLRGDGVVKARQSN